MTSKKKILWPLALVGVIGLALGGFSRWGALGDGMGDGGEEEAPAPPTVETPVDPAEPPPACEFRVEDDRVYHGTEALTVDEFLARGRRCKESRGLVRVRFTEGRVTNGFYEDLVEALRRASIPWEEID
jgi:hypothetical protein